MATSLSIYHETRKYMYYIVILNNRVLYLKKNVYILIIYSYFVDYMYY